MKPDDKTLGAYLDGALDAQASVELEREMAQSPALRASFDRMRELSAAVRTKAEYYPSPARHKTYIVEKKRWLFLAPAFALVSILFFGLGVFLAQPGEEETLSNEIVASHVRATLANRLVDVVSSDQHTVKPWLSARLPFSPTLADLSSDGFALNGARLDYIASQPVAVLVYQRRQHVIDVFVWPSARDSAKSGYARDGFNVQHFARGGMRYWIVSDLNKNELDDFARLLAAR
jgi:anti-sigma factor RsiW